MLGRENTANQEIRQRMKALRVSQWELAAALGIHPNTLGAKLRFELPTDTKSEYLVCIEDVAKKRG